jgi:hypothetical protein
MKKIWEWIVSLFSPKKEAPVVIEAPKPAEEPVVIRPDARQGWANLIEQLADFEGMTPSVKRVFMAQCIRESGRGTSNLAKDHLNYGGMKYRKEIADFAVPVDYQAHDGMDSYAKFESDLAFIRGYVAFINRSVYAGWEQFKNDSIGYINHLKAKGYAESATYVKDIIGHFAEADELLARAGAPKPEEVKAPVGDSTPFNHEDHVYSEPKIEIVDIPSILGHGKYSTPSGRAKGLVQHYTAGHISNGASGVLSMLKSLGNRQGRLGCFGMDEQGVIYVPRSLGWTQKGYHAGVSKWKNVIGMNSHLYGIEVCNPGKLVASGGKWYPYFAVGKEGSAVPTSRLRTWTSNTPSGSDHYGKQSKGTYMAFTEAQEKALINFSLWQKKVNPEYNFDWVVGHDEISGSGKSDPGACLSMPMAEWRKLLVRLAAK